MKKIIFLIVNMLIISSSSAETIPAVSPYIKQSHEAVKALGGALKQTLMATISKQGANAAINICSIEAMPITEQVSLNNNITIHRTSLKYRNINNAPSEWEQQVLIQFQTRKENGEQLKAMEFSEFITVDNNLEFRYMKAIPTNKPCLTCHGNNIEPSINSKLLELYPNDKATGFEVGDIRGAFSVTIPVK